MENKIAILINWPREIDMYYRLIKAMPTKKIEIIVNDIKSSEKGRQDSHKIIQKILINKKIRYTYFSEVYKKRRYKVVISTGETCSQKITLISLFKFFYSNTFGLMIKISHLDKLFLLIFNKPLTAEFHRSNLGTIWYPERTIGKDVVKFPDGMDLKIKNYPYPEYKDIFDIYLTLGKFETKLIKKKFSKKNCFEIGYLRYEKLEKRKILYNKIKNEFKLDKKKGIVFWTPTHIDGKDEAKNINLWMKKIKEIQENFNVIIRPHPKTLMLKPKIVNELKKLNYFVDQDHNRKIGELFKVSDLVISDYGGTIFSAIYFEKPILILNISRKSKFVKNLINNFSLDISVRKKLINLNPNITSEELKKTFRLLKQKNYKRKIHKLKKYYFGVAGGDKIIRVKKYLLKHL